MTPQSAVQFRRSFTPDQVDWPDSEYRLTGAAPWEDRLDFLDRCDPALLEGPAPRPARALIHALTTRLRSMDTLWHPQRRPQDAGGATHSIRTIPAG